MPAPLVNKSFIHEKRARQVAVDENGQLTVRYVGGQLSARLSTDLLLKEAFTRPRLGVRPGQPAGLPLSCCMGGWDVLESTSGNA